MRDNSSNDFGSLYTANSAQQVARLQKENEEKNRYKEVKDTAIFQALEEEKKQTQLLFEQNKTLKEAYEETKRELEESKRQARRNKIFGWVSFVVGTIIALASILISLLVK